MMEVLRAEAAKKIRQARSELISISTDNLTINDIFLWLNRNQDGFNQADAAGANLVAVNIKLYLRGQSSTTNKNILDALRMRCVKLLDSTLSTLDQSVPKSISPIPDEILTKVKEQKLATLLREFNTALKSAPNLCSIGYRTIISLVLKERAKISQPSSELAKKEDIGFKPDIDLAIKIKVVDQAEEKLLFAYKDSDRISFDNVAHKAGEKNLVEFSDLEAAVKNLNTLLRTII